MSERWLVTGGAGFIGTNVVLRLLKEGIDVTVIDDLSRSGSERNLKLLLEKGLQKFYNISISDIEDLNRIIPELKSVSAVVHLAGQVSLMASIKDPRRDFEINALGTLNLLEITRRYWPDARFLFSSTNKVYGDLTKIAIRELDLRYEPRESVRSFGIDIPLDLHGGYGISKGCADQYVIDYSRQYGLDTVTFRQSAICGRFQHPMADQGWAAFLVQETKQDRVVGLNGKGKQVRDLLDVEDLVELIIRAVRQKVINNRVYNIGGGPDRALSLLELFQYLRERGYDPKYEFGQLRPSDQLYYVSDIQNAISDFGWTPKYNLDEIIDRLIDSC